ncbi:MAG: 16S rRNA (adenine(1518)-N(6)/adenine(1519)-N(6))-dimethyltransferase RsmA [Candidatus Gastranaerophilales bacterium]|nr:16S rRNA (adenine(1518)-N(6)/adenine(1519)-N(6))-dimethyltransferase RsmA [Candidatus Gastranaerophilales bacterium]
MNYIERAKKYRAKKRLGQNFLIDAKAIETILDTSNINNDDTVVEIGSGLGFVTEQLIKHAKKVYAVELDEDMIKEVSKINTSNLEIIHNDILKTDLSQFGKNLKVVANIPYYITSPILAHLIGEIDDLENKNRNSISQIVLTVQYEVAKRLTADEKSPAKEFGLLSILAQFWADIDFIKKIPSRSFFPAPKVDSAIVKLTVKKTPLLQLTNYSFFRKVIKACFATRRKNIKNSLINAGFTRDAVEKTLVELNIDENLRGETLSICQMGELAEKLKGNL